MAVQNIAYLGLGTMGSGMASNLLKAGYKVTVWNRSPEHCQPLVEQGANQADTPAQATANADVVMYCCDRQIHCVTLNISRFIWHAVGDPALSGQALHRLRKSGGAQERFADAIAPC